MDLVKIQDMTVTELASIFKEFHIAHNILINPITAMDGWINTHIYTA